MAATLHCRSCRGLGVTGPDAELGRGPCCECCNGAGWHESPGLFTIDPRCYRFSGRGNAGRYVNVRTEPTRSAEPAPAPAVQLALTMPTAYRRPDGTTQLSLADAIEPDPAG